MARKERRGTVTPLSLIFQPEEAERASRLVAEKITEKQRELEFVNRFTTENTDLINLVQRLPDELHHPIMVPFGKAAFFPGRLIHTNEFMVLLGEGYYADRSSKQTVDILQRRGKALNSQVASIKAEMQDLETESSFFNSTAAEAEEGLVEIREEYIEEDFEKAASVSERPTRFAPSNKTSAVCDDDEYSTLMSRMEELEKDEDEHEESEDGDNLLSDVSDKVPQEGDVEKLNWAGLSMQSSSSGGESSIKRGLSHQVKETPSEENFIPFETNRRTQAASNYNDKDYGELSRPDTAFWNRKPEADSLKAFTCSIIEHADNLLPLPSPQSSQPMSPSQPTKPVSKFRMQRR